MAPPVIGPVVRVRLDPSVVDQLDQISAHTGDSRATILRMMIDIALQDYDWQVA